MSDFFDRYVLSPSGLKLYYESPAKFYKHYVLRDRESISLSSLDFGSLVHFYTLEEEDFNERFVLSPNKLPSDSVINILKKFVNCESTIKELEDSILEEMENQNFYSNIKDKSLKFAKINTTEAQEYLDMLRESSKTIVTSDMKAKALEWSSLLKKDPEIREILSLDKIATDSFGIYNEEIIQSSFSNLKVMGIIDHFSIDVENKILKIVDLKTTSSAITDFGGTIRKFSYWIQAAFYHKLLINYLGFIDNTWTTSFSFLVIDIHGSYKNIPVPTEILEYWEVRLDNLLLCYNQSVENQDFNKILVNIDNI